MGSDISAWCLLDRCGGRDRWGTAAEASAAAPTIRAGTELLLDADQLVPLRESLGARHRADLDLAGGRADGKVSEERILGLAGPGRYDGPVARRSSERDDVERLGQRAGLVGLDEDSVRGAHVDAAFEPGSIRREQVVADELDRAEAAGQLHPALPVIFGKAILDRDDRERTGKLSQIVDQLGGRPAAPVGGKDVVAGLGVEELAGRDIEADACFHASIGDSRSDPGDGLTVAGSRGAQPPSSATRGCCPASTTISPSRA